VRARDLGLRDAIAPRSPACPIGRFRLRDGLGRGVALPYGQAEAAMLEGLADAADAAAFRLAPGRALIAVGMSPAAERRLLAAAERLGFVTAPDDPRLRVTACAGAPACGAALLPTRAIAPRLAALADGVALHLSGCPKRCAQPVGPAVTLVGTAHGPEVTGDGSTVPAALRERLLAEARR
jgi:precorrin-3B synthase